MAWSKYALVGLLAAQAAVAAPSNNFPALRSCVVDALTPAGNIVTRVQSPSNNTWPDAKTGCIIRPETPALIAFAVNVGEVQALVKCATKTGFQPVPRSGRHHFEGWSALNGSLVIDVSTINYVTISSDRNSATIGGGTNLGEIYTKLSKVGKTFLGGICPTVALGGYLGVGGYNVQQRQYGLAVDQILSFKVVTADGSLINVSPTENPLLWFAARGGGTYGIVVEATVKTLTIPRSAMLSADFDRNTRLEVVKKWLAWSSNTPAAFTSQLNVYSNRTHLIGWYVGGTVSDLLKIVQASGLRDVANAKVYIGGNCSTENSRLFWMDPTTRCVDDATAYKKFETFYNTEPIYVEPIQPELRVSHQLADPSSPPAHYWPRANVISKTYFTLKDKPLSDSVIAEIIKRSGELADDRLFWGEWTAFGIPNETTTGSFPWGQRAQTLMRYELPGGTNQTLFAANQKWLNDFEAFFRPAVGNASYAGYIDKGITVPPLYSYYGPNVCKLIQAKKQYDPQNVFRNPFSIPVTAPPGLCS